MTQKEFTIKCIISMAANSVFRYNWQSRLDWLNNITEAAMLLADHLEKCHLLSPDPDDDS